MKKRIVALVSALILVFAMSMSVAAAGSITAEETNEINEAAGSIDFPSSTKELGESKSVADKIIETKDSVEGLTVKPLENTKALFTLAKETAKLNTDSVESVTVETVVDLKAAKGGNVTINMKLASNEKAYALHVLVNGEVERISGTANGDKVTFVFNSFSPVAIVRVTEKVDQPPYNPLWDPTSPEYAAAHAAAPAPAANVVVAAKAPKTGDVVMMVSIMTVIFMAGAAVAAAMSKKRA